MGARRRRVRPCCCWYCWGFATSGRCCGRAAAGRDFMLGLSSADRLGGDQGAAAAGAEPGGYRCRDAGLSLGRAPVDSDGPNSERVFRRGDPGDRRLGGGTTVIRTSRRAFLTGAATAVALSPKLSLGQARPRIVVIGGGFGGATCARALRRADPQFEVTLVEPNPTFTACPFSNAVIAGLRDMAAQRFGYDAIRAEGIAVAQDQATAVDPQARRVTLRGGSALDYDRLVLGAGDRDPLGRAARL